MNWKVSDVGDASEVGKVGGVSEMGKVISVRWVVSGR